MGGEIAYVCRYGHMSRLDVGRLTMREFLRHLCHLAIIVQQENGD